MRVLALDPGKTTGLVEWSPKDFLITQVAGRFDLYDYIELLPPFDIVVIENYVPRSGALSLQYDALYITGHLEAECQRGMIPFYKQEVSAAKGWATDAKLKKLGWWVKGQDHARDALRHLMLFLCVSNKMPTVLLPERQKLLAALTA